MCRACKTPPKSFLGTNVSFIKDIQQACRDGQAKVPRWLRPPRSVQAELTHQLRRLASNARHEEAR